MKKGGVVVLGVLLLLFLGGSGGRRRRSSKVCDVFLRADGPIELNGEGSDFLTVVETCKQVRVSAAGDAEFGEIEALVLGLESSGVEVFLSEELEDVRELIGGS